MECEKEASPRRIEMTVMMEKAEVLCDCPPLCLVQAPTLRCCCGGSEEEGDEELEAVW